MNNHHKLSDKRIIIVGATSGLGLATARRLARCGARLGLAGRNTASLESLRAEFPSAKIEIEHIDINSDDAETGFLHLIERLGGVDIYLHASGIAASTEGIEPNSENDLQIARTNVEGFTRMIDAAYNWFIQHPGSDARIAAITSIAGVRGIANLAAYSASKSYGQTYLQALRQLSHATGQKIRITDLRPGWVRTPLLNDNNHYPLITDADNAAKHIVKALASAPRIAYIPTRWRYIVAAWRSLPGALWERIPFSTASLSGKA